MLTFSLKNTLPKKIVLMLHGFGSSGEDMINFAHYIALPDILYVAPNATYKNDFGYKWFDIGSVENLDHEVIKDGVIKARPYLIKLIDDIALKYNMEHKNIILFGFSQGAMIALDALVNHPSLTHGIAASGAFYSLTNTAVGKNILLIHGVEDSIVEYKFSVKAQKDLFDLGALVSLKSCSNLGHSINEQGMEATKKFLLSLGGE